MVSTDVNETQINPYLDLIYKKLEWFERDELIKKFVSMEFNRFLEYYKDAKDLNVVEFTKGGKHQKDIKYNRFFINLGQLDKITPPELIGVINDLTELKHIPLGKIEIKKTFSFFEADNKFTDAILQSCDDAYFDDRKISIELASERQHNHKNKDKDIKKRLFKKGKK